MVYLVVWRVGAGEEDGRGLETAALLPRRERRGRRKQLQQLPAGQRGSHVELPVPFEPTQKFLFDN